MSFSKMECQCGSNCLQEGSVTHSMGSGHTLLGKQLTQRPISSVTITQPRTPGERSRPRKPVKGLLGGKHT